MVSGAQSFENPFASNKAMVKVWWQKCK